MGKPRRVNLMYPSKGLVLTADPTRQPPGTTRLNRNARPRDWADGGTLRGAQRPGATTLIEGLTNTAGSSVQSLAAVSVVQNIGESVLGPTLFTDNCTRTNTAADSGDLGDAFGSDATADYVIHVSTPARSSLLCLNCVGTAVWASGDSLNITSNHIVDDRAWDGTATDRISYGYFRPSAGTIPTDNFAIKVTFRTAATFSTGSSIGLFCNGASGTVNEGAFCVGISTGGGQAFITNHFKKATALGATYATICNTYDDMMILSTASPGGGASGATPYPAYVLQGDYLTSPFAGSTTVGLVLAASTTYTIEMRKSGNRVELLIDGDTVAIWPDITASGNGLPAATTPVDTTKLHFGFYTNNVGPDAHCDIAYISEILVSSLTVNPPVTATRILAVAGGDVVGDTDPTWTAVTSGSDAYEADATVALVPGLGPTASSNQSYIYVLNGASYKKILVGGTSAVLSTWAGTTGGGSLPAGAADTSQKARYGLVWRNRVVLYGVVTNPDNWYMSRAGDPEDWLYTSTTDPVHRAVAGNQSDTGLFAYAISCMSALDSDRLIVASTNQLWAMVGDPMLGGQFGVITDRVGIVGPYATTRDPYGNFYFCALDGVYVIEAGTLTPRPLSKDRIDSFFRTLDFSTLKVQMAWSRAQDGLFVFLTPTDGTAGEHLFWDRMNDAWCNDTLPADIGPTAICIYNDDNPLDDAGGDMILMGGNDGYVRRFDPRAFDDDGEQIDSQVDLPPLQADGICRVSLERLDPVWGSTSDRVSMEIRRSRAVGTLDSADAAMRRTFMATGPSAPWTARSTAGAIGIRLKSAGSGRHWSMANLSAMVGMSEDMVVRTV